MATIHDFKGSVLDATQMHLGEGPAFDPITGKLCWLNILGKELHELDISSGQKAVHALPFMASVVARIDEKRQLLASEDGLFLRDRATGELSFHADFEPGKPGNRSNDGRVHSCGALWIGTMGKKAEDGAGGIYHVASGVVMGNRTGYNVFDQAVRFGGLLSFDVSFETEYEFIGTTLSVALLDSEFLNYLGAEAHLLTIDVMANPPAVIDVLAPGLVSVAEVPEPREWLLLATGLFLLGATRRLQPRR